MLKLYDIYRDVINECVISEMQLLTEGVSSTDVKAAIDGKYNVNIYYRDYEDGTPPSRRYIQVYVYGKSKAGNDVIRAFQIFGGSKRGKKNGYWKMFRLDRIDGWFPTKFRWTKPVSDYDPSIPNYNRQGDKTMSIVLHKVKV